MQVRVLHCAAKKHKRVLGILLMAVMLFSLVPCSAFAAEKTVIRVGYDSNSHFIRETDGHFYGYGVEYLKKIAEYTGWEFEYVKDSSWLMSLSKLRRGEIDLICTAHHTEERAKEFLYSRMPFGYEVSILYARADSDISYQDYEAMQGCRIGLLKESYSAGDFKRYAQEQQIDYEGIYFNRENDMTAALEKGKIDMMVVGSRYARSDLKMVDISGLDAYHCIANTEDQALLDTIDAVLQDIMFDDPAFAGTLSAKYFGHESLSSTPLYTKEEMEYIESLGTIKIKMFQDQHPSCYVEDGETKGIWAEVVKLLAEKSGIDFVLEGGDLEDYSQESYEEYLSKGYLLLRTQNAHEHMGGGEGTVLSNAITSTAITNVSVAYVKRQAAFVEDKYVSHIIALTQDLAYLEPMLLEENPDYIVKYFPDAKACFEALINKEAGMVIQNSHRASYLMQKPEYTEKLTVVPGIDHGNEVCIMATRDQQMLINVINKAIHHMSDGEINEIVKRELLMAPYPMENEDFIYMNWKWIIVVGVLTLLALIGYAVLTNKIANAKIQKKEFEILQKKVQTDELTGLYNRPYFYERAQELLRTSDEDICIVSMDITDFKVVNEFYGVPVGDQLLKAIGGELQKLDKDKCMFPARFMADHFYFCISKPAFDRIELPKRFQTFLEDIDIRVVYGVFVAKAHTEKPINVMCDRAMEAIHDKEYNYKEYIYFYDERNREQAKLEKEIEAGMEQALEQRQFYIVVQPKYDPNTEQVIGGEVLVRWQHPEKGFISPGVFVPVFERNGFITSLDYFIWEEACRLQAELKQKGIKTVPLSINVSRIHFYGSELRHKLSELIRKYDLDHADIELEITESICGEEEGNIIDVIRQLQEDGFRIAMDDFGSGYSSLNMLKDMPLDVIKMDLKFLSGEDQKGQVILKALIEMALTMELHVVVEGVETLPQVEFLRRFEHCYAQGYYYSKPIPAAAFAEKLQENK